MCIRDSGTSILAVPEQDRTDPNPWKQKVKIVRIPENFWSPAFYIRTYTFNLRLIIYDLLGKEVHMLIDKVMNPGYYSTQWNGRNQQGQTVGAGVYLYQIQSNGFIQTRKMLLLK